jgi:hypothetical protein
MLQNARQARDLALFNLAIDSKLRGCDVVALRVDDVAPNGYAADRATVRQRKTGRPSRLQHDDASVCTAPVRLAPQFRSQTAAHATSRGMPDWSKITSSGRSQINW